MTPNGKNTVSSLLKIAYASEIETVHNYLANAIWIEGLQAQELSEVLREDVTEELGHATKLALRMKQLDLCPPGSQALTPTQHYLQPPTDPTHIRDVISGAITAEKEAIAVYRELCLLARDTDPVTSDLAVHIMAEEEHHLCLLTGFLHGLDKCECDFTESHVVHAGALV